MDKTKQALEAVQHIYLCEDEGMASGQPTKEDYLQARELVAAALSELEGPKPQPQHQDPDRHIKDEEEYLQAKRERFAKGGWMREGKQPEIDRAISLISERSKPSLMIGFSEEEIQRIVTDSIPPSAHVGLALTPEGAVAMARTFMEVGLRYANTRAVSIDKLVEVVMEWVKASGEIDHTIITCLLREERAAGMTKYEADLRQRLENIKPSNPDQ